MSVFFVNIPCTKADVVKKFFIQKNILFNDLGDSRKKIDESLDENVFSFCFVRNPYLRLRIAFDHLVSLSLDETSDSVSEFTKRRIDLKKKYGNDFEKFVIDKGFEKFNFSHFYPQMSWINLNGKRKINFIGYSEDIFSDLNFLSDYLIDEKQTTYLDAQIQLDNEKNNLSSEVIKIIKNYYHDDFVRLGYSFDPKIVSPKKKVGFVNQFYPKSKDLESILIDKQGELSNNSKYLYLDRQGSGLIVILSTHNQFDKFFALEKIYNVSSENLLFITNVNNNYFLDFDSSGNNIYASFLADFIFSKGMKSVTIFGSSMAGYAALMLASKLNLNAFVTNPQVDLALAYKFAWHDLRKTLDKLEKVEDFCYQLDKSSSYVYYVYGDAPIDKENAKYLKNKLLLNNNLIFRNLKLDTHDFPFQDNLEIINEVHNHLSFLKKYRL
ncbi:sulfotransferase family 2 domain-containing protein [Halomonas sp. Ps84H-12]|uniref:sulfotransferase family 2 domain-containing protein n=1 Tax=Halomonas sp. Ps84H-12 TaxID=2954501 RepID=UPI0020975CA7|nr:sulfotransferase family 2 domain-containing protein [Halomonas sp. Ps84H-12]MCO7244460.1 sulfotransferase family protein [Halomonas sp. Ps84H-12]